MTSNILQCHCSDPSGEPSPWPLHSKGTWNPTATPSRPSQSLPDGTLGLLKTVLSCYPPLWISHPASPPGDTRLP